MVYVFILGRSFKRASPRQELNAGQDGERSYKMPKSVQRYAKTQLADGKVKIVGYQKWVELKSKQAIYEMIGPFINISLVVQTL